MHSTEDIWRLLVRASVDRRHPWRVVALCTQGAQGPSARNVILRKVLQDTRRLVFYTDARTLKLQEIADCDRVALLLWDPHHRQQLRVWARAFAEADDEVVNRHWTSVPEAAQRDYGTAAPPGTPLANGAEGSFDFNLAQARDHFVVLNVEVAAMELLQLDRTQHQRSRHAWNEASGRWEAEALVP
jgi:pyridoxine/pyridoxamine 5'-phosphate oxidase